MQLNQRFTLTQAPANVWPSFQNPEWLIDCLPGASCNGPVVDTDGVATIPIRFDVRLGPIGANFIGSGTLDADESTLTGVFEGSAVDRKTNSRVAGSARFKLCENGHEPSGTNVGVEVEYSLTGALAQFNRPGIVHQLADTLTAEFAKRLQQRIDVAKTHKPDLDLPALSDPQTEAPPDKPAALNAFTVLWMILRQKISNFFDKPNQKKSP